MKKIIAILSGLLLTFAFVGTVSAAENWRLSGNYTITFTCTSGCVGNYAHTVNVSLYDNNDGIFLGTGYYNTNPSITWTVAGDVTGDTIEFLIDYDGSAYYVDAEGTITTDGTMSGSAVSASQSFDWVMSPKATFYRYAEITAPEENQYIYGESIFSAYLVDNDQDAVQWAIRKGTCAAGIGTVWGNVDGHNDPYAWEYNGEYTQNFSTIVDTSSWEGGMYCFIFNPTEDAGDTPIRLTREFYVAEGYVNGGGQIIEERGDKPKDDYKISFGGQVWDVGSEGYMGDWQINFHNVGVDEYDKARFHATEVQIINFYTGSNSNTCDEAMNMTLLGTLNGEEGYKVIFRAGDLMEGRCAGEYPDGIDTVRIELYESGSIVYDTHGGDFTDESSCVGSARTGLDAGNIKIEFTP